MSKVEIAEYLLSFTTTPERATSTAGDLMEQSAVRGSVWFWRTLVTTTVSLVWRELTLAPGQMAWLGFRAVVIQAIFIPVIIVVGIVGGLFVSFVMEMDGKESAVILGKSFAIFGFTASHLFIGRWLGRRARGRELAACAATIVMMRLAVAAIFMATVQTGGTPLAIIGLLRDLMLFPLDFLIQLVVLLIGVAWDRRSDRSLAAS